MYFTPFDNYVYDKSGGAKGMMKDEDVPTVFRQVAGLVGVVG